MIPVLSAVLALAALPALAIQGSGPSASARVRPIPARPRDAGVYHVASGTWTRRVSQAQLGADIIYNNTCSTGFYSPLSSDTYVDEGRVPSPSSPDNLTSKPGAFAAYSIDGFQIAYCTDQGPTTIGTYTVNFWRFRLSCG